ncbi:MAG TPA: hypothetical protein VD963_01295, partial [Phycisphaerales bacterium]|nr:hypothetical protein [Phycisphaerales bacterium]
KHGLPLVYAGVVGTRGTAGLFLPGAGPCLRCLLATPPPPGAAPTCESAGVLGAASALVAAQQAAWALKVLVGAATPEDCRLVELDPWEGAWRSLVLGHRPGPPGPERDCPCCAQRRFDYLDAGETESTALCGADSVQVWPPSAGALDLPALASHLGRSAAVTASAFAVRAVLREERADFPSPREGPGAGASTAGPEDPPSVPLELTVFADGRALVRGTRDPARARSIYARYLGG